MEPNPSPFSGPANSDEDALRVPHQQLVRPQLAQAKEDEKLRRLWTAFNQERLKFNGERELTCRQLQADRADILRQQRQLMEYRKELKRRAQALATTERQAIESKHRESDAVQRLKKEAEGLEQRIRNLRSKLDTQEQVLTKSQAVLPDLSRLTAVKRELNDSHSPEDMADRATRTQAWEGDLQEYLILIDRLASCLADERLRLINQVEHLIEARNNWEKEHAAGVHELEARFGRLAEAERTYENRAIALRKQQAEIHQTRQSLESRQARLTVQAVNWKAERERLLAQIQSLETKAHLPQANSENMQIQSAPLTEAEYARLWQQLANLEGQRVAYEKQVAELNAEVELLAGLLLDENDSNSLPVPKAA